MAGHDVQPGAARLAPGVTARWEHVVSADDIDGFAELSGDHNPLHMDDGFAHRHGFRGRVVHGMLLGAYVSRVVGMVLPGPGVLWLSQTVRFARSVHVGDRIEVVVVIKHRSQATRALVLETVVNGPDGAPVFSGEARMMMLETASTPKWSDMVAVVTGASRGIGAATAVALADRGAAVIVNFHSRDDAAGEVVAGIEASGGRATAVQADVATAEGAQALAGAALETYGRVDVVVNNASPFIERKPLLDTDLEDLDGYWSAYARGPFALIQAVAPGMRDRGFGRIVNMLTTAIWGAPPPETAAYVAAKSALWGLSRVMAVEFAPMGITVNAVSPSAIMTDQWDGTSDTRRRAMAMRLPVGRLAEPQEIAAAVVLLASPDAGYITGANLPVAGGEVM